MRTLLLALVAALVCTCQASRYVLYVTGQHPVFPPVNQLADVTHVALAFMKSSTFTGKRPSTWPLFTSIKSVRDKFPENRKAAVKILIAIGGWGDTNGFSAAAASQMGRRAFAENVKAMLDSTGADGIDLDWEYPGGNGEDYKKITNSEKSWEVGAYPKLLAEIRAVVGPDKIMSAAVPGKPVDIQVAFTKDTLADVVKSLDFLNIMTYDLMNRRDNVTIHHTGIGNSLIAIDTYLTNGVPTEKVNLGFAWYVKWFRTEGECGQEPLGCKTVLMEDPKTGNDLERSGAFSWHDKVPKELEKSFHAALNNRKWDNDGNYYWDAQEKIFWSWDTPASMAEKFPAIVKFRKLGGVFAWGLGEDADGFLHLKTMNALFKKYLKPCAGDTTPGRRALSDSWYLSKVEVVCHGA
ncbi:glycoside hydrolase family 18 protein [Aureobasidium subglaciale]|nr:glycoside hydrolase family 18 protein [Aureobasidium subglaciale]